MIEASRCQCCGDLWTPAVVACPSCRSVLVEHTRLTGTGRVLACTRVHTDAHQPSPWLLLLVEADEGVRLVGVGDGEVSVGDAVQATTVINDVPTFSAMEDVA